jgi:hypothetical protein
MPLTAARVSELSPFSLSLMAPLMSLPPDTQ